MRHSACIVRQVLVALDRRSEARIAFEAAREIWSALGERNVLLSTEAELALLELADDCNAALTAVERLLADLRADDSADLREHVQYVASRVYAAHGANDLATTCLRHAAVAMHDLLDTLPAESHTRLLQRDPLHRAVQAALAASANLQEVRLVRIGVPLVGDLPAPTMSPFTGRSPHLKTGASPVLTSADVTSCVGCCARLPGRALRRPTLIWHGRSV